MFLRSVRIQNCRSIIDAEISFAGTEPANPTRKWTMLVGENGTGKSTVLKAIGLLLAGTDALHVLLNNPASWVRRGADQCRLEAVLVTKEGEPRHIALEFSPDDTPRSIMAKNYENLAAIDAALGHADQNYFYVGYGPYRRVSDDGSTFGGRRSSHFSGNPRVENALTLFDKNAPVNPLPAWAMSLEYRQGPSGLDIVREAMNALLPGLQFAGIDREREKLIFETPDGRVDLEELSDGYQNVAAWIGDLLYRVTENFAHYKNPLIARGVLLIDEIDAHLHPTWQRRLKAFLESRLPNLQIIGTTHSALTLQQFHQEESFVVSRRDGRVFVDEFSSDPSKLMLHQLYDLAFKIGSFDSVEVEQSKEIVRQLRTVDEDSLGENERTTLEHARSVLDETAGSRSVTDAAMGNEALAGYFDKLDNVARALEQQAQAAGNSTSSEGA